jgi:TonB family protein
MKPALILVMATCVAFAVPLLGQADNPSASPTEKNKYGPIDILNDTNGFDMNAYLRQVLERIRIKWFEQIPDIANPPNSKKGNVSIKFRVMSDGNLQKLKFDSNSGDENLDRAAYGAVTASNPLPPLPSGFPCQYIDLRFRFYYNPGPHEEPKENNFSDHRTPCVTSTITSIKPVGVSVSPSQARVVVGRTQQFYATLVDANDSVVTWSVSGPGCERSACGVISTDGLYGAPTRIPNPATISVTATMTTSPNNRASSVVTIVDDGAPH